MVRLVVLYNCACSACMSVYTYVPPPPVRKIPIHMKFFFKSFFSLNVGVVMEAGASLHRKVNIEKYSPSTNPVGGGQD